MSIESAMLRMATLQAWSAAPAPVPTAATPPVTTAAPGGGTSFQAQLASAMTPATSATAAAPHAHAHAVAAPGTYPHLSGDLDADPELLARLEKLAASRGENFKVTSGLRTVAEQQVLWDNRHNNPFPVAPPGTSLHQHGNAADVTVNGVPIQNAISRDELIRAGLSPLAGDEVHVELPR